MYVRVNIVRISYISSYNHDKLYTRSLLQTKEECPRRG